MQKEMLYLDTTLYKESEMNMCKTSLRVRKKLEKVASSHLLQSLNGTVEAHEKW